MTVHTPRTRVRSARKVGISIAERRRLRRVFASRVKTDSLANHSDEMETHSRGLERVPRRRTAADYRSPRLFARAQRTSQSGRGKMVTEEFYNRATGPGAAEECALIAASYRQL